MDEQQVRAIVQQEVAKQNQRDQFKLSNTNYHTHNGTDSLIAMPGNIISYVGEVAYDFTEVLLPTGWTVGGTSATVTTTAGIALGATSATLSSTWGAGTSDNETFFSNGDIRTVTYTNGSANITWSGGLSSNATSTLEVVAPGVYRIIHNIGTTGGSTPYYSFVASSAQGNNIVTVPVVSQFPNEVSVSWYDLTGALQKASFVFNLTVINNQNHSYPTYKGTSTT